MADITPGSSASSSTANIPQSQIRVGRLEDKAAIVTGGATGVAETDQYPVDGFDRTVRDNLRTAFLMTKFALPHLRKTKGNVVNAGSEAGPRTLCTASRWVWPSSRRSRACGPTASAPA